MRFTTATTTATALSHVEAGPAVLLVEEQPAYRYMGDGRFEPANAAAHAECAAWNTYAAMITARSAASRSL